MMKLGQIKRQLVGGYAVSMVRLDVVSESDKAFEVAVFYDGKRSGSAVRFHARKEANVWFKHLTGRLNTEAAGIAA